VLQQFSHCAEASRRATQTYLQKVRRSIIFEGVSFCPTESKACTIIFVHWTMMVFGMQTKYKYLNSVLLILKVIRMAVISWVQFFLLPLVWKRLWYQTTVYIEFFTKNITLCIKKKKKLMLVKKIPQTFFLRVNWVFFLGIESCFSYWSSFKRY